MKLFRELILETATPEEIQLAQQRLTQEFKSLNRVSEEVRLNLLASEIREIRTQRNMERINSTLNDYYGVRPELGQIISKKLEEITALYHKLESDIASLKFMVNIGGMNREQGQKELSILESKLERVKRIKMELENAMFHYKGLIEDLKNATQEEIELKQLYP